MEHLHFRKQSKAYEAIGENEWFSKDNYLKCYKVYRDYKDCPTTVYRIIHWKISDGNLNIPE